MEHEEGEVEDFSDFDDESACEKTKCDKNISKKISKRKSKRKHQETYEDTDSRQHKSKANTKSRLRGSESKDDLSKFSKKAKFSRESQNTFIPKKMKCKYYMEGRCTRDDCPYDHEFVPDKKSDVCRYYLSGNCAKGENCVYHHEDFPCKYFHSGKICKMGDNCRFSHQPLTPEFREMLDNYLSQETFFKERNQDDMNNQGNDIDLRNPLSNNSNSLNYITPPCFGRQINMGGMPPPHVRPSMNIPPPQMVMRQPLVSNSPHIGPRPFNGSGPFPFRTLRPPHTFPHHNSSSSDVDYRNFRPNHQPGQLGPPFYGSGRPPRPFVPNLHPPCPPNGNHHGPMPFYPGNFVPPMIQPNIETMNRTAFVENFEDQQIDHIAALIAAPTKTPNDQTSSTTNSENESRKTIDPRLSNTKPNQPILSSPDKIIVPTGPVFGGLPKSSISWKLEELDLSDQIKYCQMDLPRDSINNVDDVQLVDPRLTTRASIFSASINSLPQLSNHVQKECTSPDSSKLDEDNTTDLTTEKTLIETPLLSTQVPEPTQSEMTKSEEIIIKSQELRRPMKLKLNEMANTAVSTSKEEDMSSDSLGQKNDRSYLADPRFKRKKIVFSSAS